MEMLVVLPQQLEAVLAAFAGQAPDLGRTKTLGEAYPVAHMQQQQHHS
jgi:hypothetical protein